MKCILCRCENHLAMLDTEVVVDGKRFKGKVEGEECGECGELFFYGLALEAFYLLVACHLAKEMSMSNETMHFIYKVLLCEKSRRGLGAAEIVSVEPIEERS